MNDSIIDTTEDMFKSFSVNIKKLEDKVGKELARRLNTLLRTRLNASGLKVRTGALNRSLVVNYSSSDNSIEVGVLIYGVFNSYGVGPRVKSGKIYRIDDWVRAGLDGTPRGGDKFSYNPSYRKFGIKARKWLPGDDALQLILDDIIKSIDPNKL